MTLHPIHAAELIVHFEACAIDAEAKGGVIDAECIRRNTPGLIEAIAKVDAEVPGYAQDCIRAMMEKR